MSKELFEVWPDRIRQDIIYYAAHCTANRVYPLSVAQGFQRGDIFVDEENEIKSLLFWHHAGFAYLSGEADEAFLDGIYRRFLLEERDRRFVLITDDPLAVEFFSGRKGIATELRTEYRYDGNGPADIPACKYPVEAITEANIRRIHGRITPSFSWASERQFFQNGFGFVAMDGEAVAAVAFSAAVSSDEVDIGVETAEPYRRLGLATILADRMCREILAKGKRPVWAHSALNIGSMKTAERVGFMADKINTVIKKSAAGT